MSLALITSAATAGLLPRNTVIVPVKALAGQERDTIWDDGAHMTRAELQSWDGLRRIWFEPGLFGETQATQQ